MKKEQISALVRGQRQYFDRGMTLDVKERIDALKRLQQALREREPELAQALRRDLGKSASESYMCEIGMVLEEIRWLLRHIRGLAKDQTVRTPLAQFCSHSFRRPTPYGVALIMSPWNYPVLLTLGPLADALAAGNTAVVKPSAYAPHTSALLADLLGSIFPEDYVAVIQGGREENTWLLEEKFDCIFFTGSKAVGRTVLEKAAQFLTPVTLELGGKSPCIVHSSADIALAARRIVFGKYLNCGQTCVAPDYILCHESVKEQLLDCVKKEIRRQYGPDYEQNPSYGKMISKRHFDRVRGLIEPSKVVQGGRWDEERLRIEPTVMDGVTWQDDIMQEEIFGPVMPVLTFSDESEVIDAVNSHDKPLALYVFASDKGFIRTVTHGCQFGGGCINDTIIHLATTEMGFGGVGESGMGAYHGKAGFDCFSHYKSIVDKKTWLDLPMRYQPYNKWNDRLIRMFLR